MRHGPGRSGASQDAPGGLVRPELGGEVKGRRSGFASAGRVSVIVVLCVVIAFVLPF